MSHESWKYMEMMQDANYAILFIVLLLRLFIVVVDLYNKKSDFEGIEGN